MMIQSLCNIRAAKKRFPDLSNDRVAQLSMICTRIVNGATWYQIIKRLELGRLRWSLTPSDLADALMAFNAGELEELNERQQRNRVNWIRQVRRDFKEACWHQDHPRVSVWPEVDEDALEWARNNMAIDLPVQINGKKRGVVTVSAVALEVDVVDLVHENQKIKSYLSGKQITRIVYVPGRIINFVVTDKLE